MAAVGRQQVKCIEAYNTDSGWLSLSKEELVDRCRMLTQEEGFRG